MLDALVNFAMVNVAFIVVATVVGVYGLVRLTNTAKTTSAQLDAHTRDQLAAIDRDRESAREGMDIHSRV